MLELLAKGGWVLYPILFGSLVGLAIFFERFWALRRSKVCPPDLARQLQLLIHKNQWTEARSLCQREKSALARIFSAALSQGENNPTRAELKEAVEEAGQREAFFLERGIGSLGVVASLEPLMGLLGTVLGMITAFRRVEVGGVGDPRLVASGVWVALLTTAVGLTIAIPAYIGYRFLLARLDRWLIELQNESSMLVDLIIQQNKAIHPPEGGALRAKSAPQELLIAAPEFREEASAKVEPPAAFEDEGAHR